MSDTNDTDGGVERRDLASEMLDGLDDGFHYATLVYDDDHNPVEVAWNYDAEPGRPGRNDDFTDRDLSERRRALAIEHQQQYEDDQTHQAKLPVADGGSLSDVSDHTQEADHAGE